MFFKKPDGTEVNVIKLRAECEVRYWEDASVNGREDTNGDLIPCRDGLNWVPEIDLESGCILNWKKGTVATIHYKVCDAGKYDLIDEEGNVVATKEGYVPKIMYPKSEGFGDYVIMDVAEDGKIQDWKPDLKAWTR